MNISFIIPVFNGAKSIKTTINSILSQLVFGDEIIVVNDGSTDETHKKIKKLKKVKVITQKNQGVSCARNVGAKLAKGDILIFFDSDDILSSGIVSLAKEGFIERPDINWCFGYYNISRNNISTIIKSNNITKGAYSSVFQLYNKFALNKRNELLSTCALFFRRNVFIEIGGFDETMISGEDTFMWLKFGLYNPKIYYLNSMAFTYKRANQQTEQNTHIARSRKEANRIYEGYKLIRQSREENGFKKKDAFKVVNIWHYRHLKLSMRFFNIKQILLLFIIKVKYQFYKWS